METKSHNIMNRILFVVLSLLFCSFCANAQDLIAKLSGEVIECRIVSSDGDKVRYVLKYDPFYTYTMKKSEIHIIRYASGEVVNVNDLSQPRAQKREADMSIVPYMNYRQLKRIYDFRDYERSYMDRFSPGWIGFASFLLPGLGECICDEWGRGLGKFVGAAACTTAGTLFTMASYVDANWGTDIAFAVIFYAAALSFDIWSIVDATRISKVRNMYESDMREKYAFDLSLFPSVNCVNFGNSSQLTAGLTLAIRF